MEKIHSHTNCPACTASLSGEENHCPFCGYRIVFESNSESTKSEDTNSEVTTDVKDNGGESSISQVNGDLSSEGSLEKEVYHSPEIVKIEENIEVTTPQENEISENETDNLFIVENSEIKEEPKDNIENIEKEEEIISGEITLLNDDEAEVEEKKYKKNKILIRIILVVIILLIALGTLTILHYYNKVDVFFLPDSKSKNSEIIKQVNIVEKNYYFCYSTGKINKKNIIVFSKIFKLDQKGNDEASATKIYKKQFDESLPNETANFTTTICKKFSNPVTAFAEKDKLIKKYLKLKYGFRFIEIKQ
jgi:hypothetical protein